MTESPSVKASLNLVKRRFALSRDLAWCAIVSLTAPAHVARSEYRERAHLVFEAWPHCIGLLSHAPFRVPIAVPRLVASATVPVVVASGETRAILLQRVLPPWIILLVISEIRNDEPIIRFLFPFVNRIDAYSVPRYLHDSFMQSSLFDYVLPPERIAQEPIRPRDHSRLLVLDRTTGAMDHRHFFEIGEFLKSGDLLIVNDSKVFKARLRGEVISHESRVTSAMEVFLLRPLTDCDWVVLLKPGKKAAVGSTVSFRDDVSCEVKEKHGDGTVRVSFNKSPEEIITWTDHAGEIPVPPYVGHAPEKLDDYQTVYADKTGSVAAPTAGFHFTPELIAALKEKGIQFASVTLHVGLGTFRPMQSETLEEHVMHEEWFEIPEATIRLIEETKQTGGRVIAVGTTTVRALESGSQAVISKQEAVNGNADRDPLTAYRSPLTKTSGLTSIFITPGYRFQIVDALITNFHLPKSTLLVLVSAFAGTIHQDADVGRKMILRAYEEAIKQEYRFYSFGDAMLIQSAGSK